MNTTSHMLLSHNARYSVMNQKEEAQGKLVAVMSLRFHLQIFLFVFPILTREPYA